MRQYARYYLYRDKRKDYLYIKRAHFLYTHTHTFLFSLRKYTILFISSSIFFFRECVIYVIYIKYLYRI